MKLKKDELRAKLVETPSQNAKRVGTENAKILSAAAGKGEPPALKSREFAVEAAQPKRYSMSESKSEPKPQSKSESSGPAPSRFGVPERFRNILAQKVPKETASPEVRVPVSKPTDAELVQLMKVSLDPIISAAKGKDPEAVSEAVKTVKASFRASLPGISEAELDLAVKGALTAALRQRPSETTDMHLAMIGKAMLIEPGKKPVVQSDEKDNKLWEVATRSFHGFSSETREETANVQLVRDAVAANMRRSK